MKEIATYVTSSFVDYKGVEHKFTVCALSRKVNEDGTIKVSDIGVYEDDDWEPTQIFNTTKVLSFGVAVCNPTDTFNEEHGKMIAYNKAKSDKAPFLTSSRLGFFNTTTVDAILNNYVDFIKRDPGSVINGYDKAKKQFLEDEELNDELSHLTEEDKQKIRILAFATPENLEYAKKMIKYVDPTNKN